jgi:hypothetical protein
MNETERKALGAAIRTVIDKRVQGISEKSDGAVAQLWNELMDLRGDVESIGESLTGLVRDALAAVDVQTREQLDQLTQRSLSALDRAAHVRDGLDGETGPPGPQGPDGRPGSLSDVLPHVPGEIYRAGEFVCLPRSHPLRLGDCPRHRRHLRPTRRRRRAWEPYVFHGEPGPAGMAWRGEHVAGTFYREGDAVLGDNGGAWIRTAPGTSAGIPGDGWQVLAKRGATGTRGKRGEAGRDGVGIVDLDVSGHELVVTLSDGTAKRLPLPVIVVERAP